jgi:hypothetical protein
MVRPGETGLLAKPRDPGDLSKKLISLLSDRELFQTLSDGCLRDVERYSKGTHLDRLESVFSEALDIGARAKISTDVSDLNDSVHRVLEKTKDVEDWANGMHTHIMHLENVIAGLQAEKTGLESEVESLR